jgi:hypothetical protein
MGIKLAEAASSIPDFFPMNRLDDMFLTGSIIFKFLVFFTG